MFLTQSQLELSQRVMFLETVGGATDKGRSTDPQQ